MNSESFLLLYEMFVLTVSCLSAFFCLIKFLYNKSSKSSLILTALFTLSFFKALTVKVHAAPLINLVSFSGIVSIADDILSVLILFLLQLLIRNLPGAVLRIHRGKSFIRNHCFILDILYILIAVFVPSAYSAVMLSALALMFLLRGIASMYMRFKTKKEDVTQCLSIAVLLFGVTFGIFIDKSGMFYISAEDAVYPAIIVFSILNLFSLARFCGLSKNRETMLSERVQAAENAFMNAQMKPHFIYNALNTIADRCTKDPDDAERLILLLSKYMRQTLSYDSLSGMTPLKKELDIVKAYAEIECRRFDNINVYYILPDELPDITLPPLTIQPLVENAIKHGLRKKHGGGYVVITIKRKKDMAYVISVEDNGVGINDEALDAMLNIPSGSDSIGLYNINQRLLSLFGTGLTVEKPEDGGTRVYFEIPEYNR